MPKHTILIVDDELSIVETLADILVWEGYEVVSAPHGAAALALLAGGRRRRSSCSIS